MLPTTHDTRLNRFGNGERNYAYDHIPSFGEDRPSAGPQPCTSAKRGPRLRAVGKLKVKVKASRFFQYRRGSGLARRIIRRRCNCRCGFSVCGAIYIINPAVYFFASYLVLSNYPLGTGYLLVGQSPGDCATAHIYSTGILVDWLSLPTGLRLATTAR